jgi:hypothetical protein
VNLLTRTRGQFTRTLGDTIAQLMEGRKRMPDASDAVTCPEQTAERDPQLLVWETPVDAKGSPMVVQDIARIATVVQGGGVVMKDSRSGLGSESSGIKSYEICPAEAQIASDLEQNKRPRLRRKSRMPRKQQLTLKIPGKTP